LLAPVRRPCPLDQARKILVIGTGGIGDVVMKMPLFTHIRQRFPQAEIVLFTSSGPERELVESHPGIDRIFTLEQREAMRMRHPLQVIRNLRKLRAERFDMTLTTHQGIGFTGAVFSYLLGAPIRVGFDKGGRGVLYTHRVEVEDVEARHAVDWNLDLAVRLGINVDTRQLSLPLPAQDRQFAADLLAGAGVAADQVVIALFQGSKRRSRLWLGDRFAQLADALADRYRSRILLFGAENERPAIEAIAGAMRSSPIVAIGQTIRQTAALIERSGLLVSCDSGPVHIAAALETPVVALFGPETPVRVGPYGERSAVVRHDLPCSPCHGKDCRFGRPRCMELITVDEVLRTIEARAARWGLASFRKLDRRRDDH
jgi:lipopolysaccharide heptosyltransferase II